MSQKSKMKKNPILITIYIVLRILIIICLINQIVRNNWNNVFYCFLTLILFTLPNILDKKLKIKLPSTLEIIIYLFIFSSAILGEIQNFYGIFKHWDTILHTLNGFIMGGIGLSLIDILNRKKVFDMNLSPFFVSLFAFCFSMTIGILWEFGEYGFDKYLKTDCQKDWIIENITTSKISDGEKKENISNIVKTTIYTKDDKIIEIDGYLDIGLIDTMKDLFVNFIGAIVFSILGYLYVINRERYQFLEKFFPKLM